MAYLMIRLKVKDFSKFKSVFEEFGETRKKYGSKGVRLFRNADNPNEVVPMSEWESIEKAKKFAQSEDLKKAMERAGSIGKPEFIYLEEVEKVSA